MRDLAASMLGGEAATPPLAVPNDAAPCGYRYESDGFTPAALTGGLPLEICGRVKSGGCGRRAVPGIDMALDSFERRRCAFAEASGVVSGSRLATSVWLAAWIEVALLRLWVGVRSAVELDRRSCAGRPMSADAPSPNDDPAPDKDEADGVIMRPWFDLLPRDAGGRCPAFAGVEREPAEDERYGSG